MKFRHANVLWRRDLVVWGAVVLSSCLAAAAPDEASRGENAARLVIHYSHLNGAPEPRVLKLRGADARQQVLVTAILNGGLPRDLTHEVAFEMEPEGVARIDASGRITPLMDGQARLIAKGPDGMQASLDVVVEDADHVRRVNFPNQIVPIFTKTGCNGGGCHGKSGGQNGFKLSLLGFEPTEDYEYLVREARGRRIFPAAPDRSLLLLKATAELAHGGGKRLEKDSDDYQLLVRWINQGMPYGQPDDPTVEHIEVIPSQRTLPLEGRQQLAVVAHYTDGSVEDVTRSALYEANDQDMAKTDEHGLVQMYRQPGEVGVMVRYQGQVDVFRATVPLGAPVGDLPSPNNFIDEHVFAKLKTVGMPPSALCDDATFLRRVTIDVAGRLPTAEESQRFLEDGSPDKRNQWIDYLLGTPAHADYFANKWSALLRNKRDNDREKRGTYAFHAWLRDSLFENKPYDEFVRDIVSASGDMAMNPPVAWYREVRDTKAQMEDVAQLFLGTRLQCAQCHHHPFEKWSQDDYYSFSAFFSRVGRKNGSQPGEEIVFHRRGQPSAQNPKTKESIRPSGLGEEPVELAPEDDPRDALVDWMTKEGNPFFAQSLVNRYWKHFFNRGLVEPEDDMRDTNPATNPELLEALSRSFVNSGYDLKALVRAICRSRTYQLSAVPNEHNAVDKQLFSRYYPKRLTAEVLLDAIDQLTGVPTSFSGLPDQVRAVQLPDNSFNSSSYFLTVFGRPDSASACECERSQDASLAQSLHLLNSKDIQEKLGKDESCAAQLAADTDRDPSRKVKELYYTAFSRPPTESELGLALEYLNRPPRAETAGDTPPDPGKVRRQAYEDVLWALINTKEFLFNH